MRDLKATLIAGAAFVVGLGATFALAVLFPSQDWAAFILAFLTWIVVPTVIATVWHRRWLSILAYLTCAVALMSAANLPGALALSAHGQPIHTTVAEHEITHPWVSGARTTSHRFVLERTDGTRLGEDLVSKSSRFEDLDVGDTITVVVDPDGEVPLKVASDVEPGTAIGLLIFGVGGMALVLGLCIWRSWRSTRRPPFRSQAPRVPGEHYGGSHRA